MWTRERIEGFLASAELDGYQRIELPYGLCIPGADREPSLRAVFGPGDLADKTVLDVGCHYGAMCHLMREYGAMHATGVEAQSRNYNIAAVVARILNDSRVRIRLMNIETESPHYPFDVSLLFNVIHHFKFPVATLTALATGTLETMVIEWPTLDHYRRIFGLTPPRDWNLGWNCNALIGDTNGGWHYTQAAIESIVGRCGFKVFRTIESPKAEERRITICQR